MFLCPTLTLDSDSDVNSQAEMFRLDRHHFQEFLSVSIGLLHGSFC